MVIETERLSIRVARADDAAAYHAMHSDPDVTRWLGGPMPGSVEGEAERIERNRVMHDELGFTMWAVEEKESGEVAGVCGLFRVENVGPEIEVGYHFRKDRWGRGYATEAALACVGYGFDTVGLDRIVGLVAPDNVASARVLEKCGMKLEGRAHHYDMDLLKYAVARRSAPG